VRVDGVIRCGLLLAAFPLVPLFIARVVLAALSCLQLFIILYVAEMNRSREAKP
jgi:hypothetical protein